MSDRSFFVVSLIGTIVAALCCFTPVLVILVTAVGLSAVIGWLDYLLFPALGGFAVLTLYALWRLRRRESEDGEEAA